MAENMRSTIMMGLLKTLGSSLRPTEVVSYAALQDRAENVPATFIQM